MASIDKDSSSMNHRTLTTAACLISLGLAAFAGCAAEENTPSKTSGSGPVTGGSTAGTSTTGTPATTSAGNAVGVTSAGVTSAGATTGASTTTTGVAATSGGATSGAATTGAATTGASSTTGSTGGPDCVGTGMAAAAVPLMPHNGFVDCASNTIGIQGYFFTYSDMGGSSIMPADFSAAADEICVTGTVGQVMDDDYSATYGAGLGFNFNQTTGSSDANTWDATAAGISGIQFNISSFPTGAGMRVIFQSGGSDYCAPITAGGAQTVNFADATKTCYDAADPGPSGSATTLEQVKWQVTTDADATHDFDFCLTDIALVP